TPVPPRDHRQRLPTRDTVPIRSDRFDSAVESARPLEGRMSDDPAYRFGFLCRAEDHEIGTPPLTATWHRVQLTGAVLHVQPDAAIHSVETVRGERAIAVGDIFVAHGQQNLDELLLRIAAGDRAPLEDLSGRFALFLDSSGGISVVNDPLGTQTV